MPIIEKNAYTMPKIILQLITVALTGDPYGVHVVSSSVFTVKKIFPDEQMRHRIKDMNIVSHGLFPIPRPKLEKKDNIHTKCYFLLATYYRHWLCPCWIN